MRSLIPVVTSAESSARDAAGIAAGIPSSTLMGRAGAAVAGEIAQRFPEQLARGVLVLAGPGNNGGDGWVIARALTAAGVDVRIASPGVKQNSTECVRERRMSPDVLTVALEADSTYSGEGVVVDALLGTGASGPIRKPISDALPILDLARRRRAAIVAVDLPSGLDATTGEPNGAVRADLTVTFDSIKRGQLIARGLCGTIVAVDIGLQRRDADMTLVDAVWVRENVPPIGVEAHKGSRKKLLFHGGAPGMAGAVILGLRAALRSGIGMVKARVHPDSIDAVHGAVPATLIDAWPPLGQTAEETWADVLVIGPGLGRGDDARRAIHDAAARHRGPMLLDADALTAFEGKATELRDAIAGHNALLTPHVVEAARLMSVTAEQVLAHRFDIGAELARITGATVLLKGVPTIVSRPDGRRLVVAAGTPTLATGGSGDLLSGIAGTLLAQMSDPLVAAACAAWIHGRASELAGARVRGTTLEEVLEMLPNAWAIDDRLPRYPILHELRTVPSE